MSDVDVLNPTLATEYLGIAAYDAALRTGVLDGPTADAACERGRRARDG
jgi:hypothetical protein